MEQISSKDNEKIKQLIKLQTSRKARRESGCFVAEGVRMAQEALRCGLQIRRVFGTQDNAGKYAGIWEQLCQRAQEAYRIAGALEEKISQVQSPQGIYCVCEVPQVSQQDILQQGERKLLALDCLQDPGNLGTIIRTADAFGADGMILGEGCADCYSPKVLRSTMGSLFRLKIWTVPDLAATLTALQQAGFCCYGAALDETALQLGEFPFPKRCVAVIGNEGNGISPEVLSCCGHTLYIPMKGEAESLNAGVAASLILWEMCR